MTPTSMRPRRRGRIAAVAAAVLAVSAASAPSALAIPPGGPGENRAGANVTLTTQIVAPGATLAFAGTGFNAAEVVSVKIDDGLVLPVTGVGAADVFATATANGSGEISGTVDLSTAQPAFAADLANGSHNLRFLSTAPRSLHVDFAVTSLPAGPPEVLNGSTAFVSPPADQLWEFPAPADDDRPYSGIPRLVAGSLVPFRFGAFLPGQLVTLKHNDAATNALQLAADASGNGSGTVAVDTSTPGTSWIRFLAGPPPNQRSIRAPYAVVANSDGRDVSVSPTVAPGGNLAYATRGLTRRPVDYVPSPPTGQTFRLQIDGGAPITVTAGADGVATGTIPVPATLAAGTHTALFTIGFAKQNDFPQAVFARTFQVATPVAPKPAAAVAKRFSIRSSVLRAKKGKVGLRLAPSSRRVATTVAIRTSGKVKIKPRSTPRLVTLARRTFTNVPGANRTITLTLTKDGKALLRRFESVQVKVTIKPASGSTVTKTLPLTD